MTENNTSEKLVLAYNRMMERVKAALEHAGHDTLPSVQQHIESAKKKAVELGELTREEAEKIGTYVKRDLHDAADYLTVTGKELAAWLRFDMKLVEQRVLDVFSTMVDRTRQELDKLGLRAKVADESKNTNIWHTGEVTGVGTLSCAACGQPMHFHATGRIPPCPKCYATRFRRISGNNQENSE
ncbi:MAG: zinc ribbon-containing protein [Gammaproteobacteria bacterium]